MRHLENHDGLFHQGEARSVIVGAARASLWLPAGKVRAVTEEAGGSLLTQRSKRNKRVRAPPGTSWAVAGSGSPVYPPRG